MDLSQENLKFSISKQSKLIVAVSGGADSIALLHLLYTAGFQCIAAHCNFHLRGEESNRDERFVNDFCQNLHIPLRKIDFATETFAQIRNLSTEMAARELRYQWFEQLRLRENADYIAVAHHADDVIETFMINLARGAGLRGLAGIKEINGKIWRPLLKVSRNEILDYLKENALSHVEDSTNEESVYQRNKFRNEIIPFIQSYFPNWKNSVLTTISNLKSVEDYTEFHIAEDIKKILSKNGDSFEIETEELKKYGSAQSFLLHKILTSFHFSNANIADVQSLIENHISGKQFNSVDTKHTLFVSAEKITILPTKTNDLEKYQINSIEEFKHFPIRLDTQIVDNQDLQIEKNANILYADLSKVKFPLTLRHWEEGDYFIPFGMKGKKKLSDFFIDQKVRDVEKKNIWLLTMQQGDEEQILWVVGHRSDNRIRIDKNTDKVLIIKKDVS